MHISTRYTKVLGYGVSGVSVVCVVCVVCVCATVKEIFNLKIRVFALRFGFINTSRQFFVALLRLAIMLDS
jgi:hypothetical protein